MKSLYLQSTAPPISTLSTSYGRYAGFLYQIARVGYVFTKQSALMVSISFASVMQVANGDPVKVTIEGARFRRFKANARTRSWHGTKRGWGYVRIPLCTKQGLYAVKFILSAGRFAFAGLKWQSAEMGAGTKGFWRPSGGEVPFDQLTTPRGYIMRRAPLTSLCWTFQDSRWHRDERSSEYGEVLWNLSWSMLSGRGEIWPLRQ